MSNAHKQIAIVSAFSRPYAVDSQVSLSSMTLDAVAGAILEAGLKPSDVDGISGSHVVPTHMVQSGLRLPEVVWWCNSRAPFLQQLIEGVNAVKAGAATTVVCYHSTARSGSTSKKAASDPFRRHAESAINPLGNDADSGDKGVAYGTWADRYLTDAKATRMDAFAPIALNNRAWAVENEHAALRKPLTRKEYEQAPLLRGPLSRYDMDFPVDGADAFVITTLERARDLSASPVVIESLVMGQTMYSAEEQLSDLHSTGQSVAMSALWSRTDLGLNDVDLFFPYDGFTVLAARWFELVGYCGYGEAPDFLHSNWHAGRDRLLINGRVPVNTHGGSLSDGGTQGVGHVREAVLQLQGRAESRQISDASVALVPSGGFFYNAAATLLRRDR